jgi:hypothetical protein
MSRIVVWRNEQLFFNRTIQYFSHYRSSLPGTNQGATPYKLRAAITFR